MHFQQHEHPSRDPIQSFASIELPQISQCFNAMGMVMVYDPQLICYHTEANRRGASIDLTASNEGTLKKKRS